jgi:hypothetical protein
MKLFLFSASVFYILGLKIISKVEIQPFFHQKSVSTEMTTSPSKKIEQPLKRETKVQEKKDSLTHISVKSDQLPEPSVKNSKK